MFTYSKPPNRVPGTVILTDMPGQYIGTDWIINSSTAQCRWPITKPNFDVAVPSDAVQDPYIVSTYGSLRHALVRVHAAVHAYIKRMALAPNVPIANMLYLDNMRITLDHVMVYDLLWRLCAYGCGMPAIYVSSDVFSSHEQYTNKRDTLLASLSSDKKASYYAMMVAANVQPACEMPPLVEMSCVRDRRGNVISIDKRVLYLAVFAFRKQSLEWLVNWDKLCRESFPMIAFVVLVEEYEPIMRITPQTHTYLNSGRYACPLEYELDMVSMYLSKFGTLTVDARSTAYADFCVSKHLDQNVFTQYMMRINRALHNQLFTSYNTFATRKFFDILRTKGILTGVNKYTSIGKNKYSDSVSVIELEPIAEFVLPQSVYMISHGCWFSGQ